MEQTTNYFVIDGHCDALYQLEQEAGQGSLKQRPQGQVDIKRLQEGQVVAQFFALYGGEPNRLLLAQSSALKQIKLLYRELRVNPELMLAFNPVSYTHLDVYKRQLQRYGAAPAEPVWAQLHRNQR